MYLAIAVLGCVVACGSNYHHHSLDEGLQANTKNMFEPPHTLIESNERNKRASDPNTANLYLQQNPNLQMATVLYFGPKTPAQTKPNDGQHFSTGNLVNKEISRTANVENVFEHNVPDVAKEQNKIVADQYAANLNLFQHPNLQMAIVYFFGSGTSTPSSALEQTNQQNKKTDDQHISNPTLQQQKNIEAFFGPESTSTNDTKEPIREQTKEQYKTTSDQNIIDLNIEQQKNIEALFGTDSTFMDSTKKPQETYDQHASNPFLTEYSNSQAALLDFFGPEVGTSGVSTPVIEHKESSLYSEPTTLYNIEEINKQKDDVFAGNPYLSKYPNLETAMEDFFGPKLPELTQKSNLPKKQHKRSDNQLNNNSNPPKNLTRGILSDFGPEWPLPPSKSKNTTEINQQPNKTAVNNQNPSQNLKPVILESPFTTPVSKEELLANNPYLSGYSSPKEAMNDLFGPEVPNPPSSNTNQVQTKQKGKETDEQGDVYRFLDVDTFIKNYRRPKGISHAPSKTTNMHEHRKIHHSAGGNSSDRAENLARNEEMLSVFGTPGPNKAADDSGTRESPSTVDHTDSPLDSESEDTNKTTDDYRFASSTMIIERYKASYKNGTLALKSCLLVYFISFLLLILSFV